MLEVKKIRKKYNNKVIFDNVSFNVKKGDIISIIGKSGSGKSTLLKCLNKLETVDDGKIILDGIDINSMNLQTLRTKIGIVFQDYNLFDHLTVMENLVLGLCKVRRIDENKAIVMAENMLKRLKLFDKQEYYPDELSGGQKQRIAIARTLLLKPDIILLDEPTSALDKEMKKEVLKLLNEIAKEDMTLIIVSHEQEFIQKISTKIYKLENERFILVS